MTTCEGLIEINDICKQNNRTFWTVFGMTSSKLGQCGDQFKLGHVTTYVTFQVEPVQTGQHFGGLNNSYLGISSPYIKSYTSLGFSFQKTWRQLFWSSWSSWSQLISVDLSWSQLISMFCSWNPANWMHFYPSYLHTRKRAKFRATNMGGNKHSALKDMSNTTSCGWKTRKSHPSDASIPQPCDLFTLIKKPHQNDFFTLICTKNHHELLFFVLTH